jgi:hypothetical protein
LSWQARIGVYGSLVVGPLTFGARMKWLIRSKRDGR